MSRTTYLYDDPVDLPWFAPFTQSRPISELRYGAWLLRERWQTAWGPVAGIISSAHLERFVEPGAPDVMPTVSDEGERWFFRSTLVPDPGLDLVLNIRNRPIRFHDTTGADVGCFLPPGTSWPGSPLPEAWPTLMVPGRRMIGVWQIIGDLLPVLRVDIEEQLRLRAGGRIPAGVVVIGEASQLLIDDAAMVEPLVVFDTRNGPIWIRSGAEIRSGSRLTGPLVVGEGARIVGGQLRDSSIGPRCVVHGEVSSCVFVGYANKAHDGFLGHSIVGRWANLGAGTITSNLKNTYGSVRLNLGAERVETGMTFLGSLIGDHVKTAIGTMLPTGCVLGTGANVFGTKRPESFVPAFAWGTDEAGRRMKCRMFLQTASRVLPRRDIAFDDATAVFLQDVFTNATGESCV